MGRSIVGIVVDALQEAGFSAFRAMPPGEMGELTGQCATVLLHRLEPEQKQAEVKVTVLSPAHLGASVCEDGALQILWVLQGAGGSCRQEAVAYSSQMDVFCANVFVTFSGEETENGWVQLVPEPEPEFSVFVGEATDSAAILFTARRAVDDTVTVLDGAVWHYRLEERFALDEEEPQWPQEPFSITVTREGRTERYDGCVVTSQRRSLDATGQAQVREGMAQTMTVLQ